MILKEIRLRNFRTHADLGLTLGPGINVICGPNGIGKTNILEAAHFLCLTRSFLTSNDQYAVRYDADCFEVEGNFSGEKRRRLMVRVAYAPGSGKRIFINGSPLERRTDLIGQIPVVVFSPDDIRLTSGGPDERRRFLNSAICQSSAVYLNDLLRYRKALRQRNELLQQARRSGRRPDPGLHASWTGQVLMLGSRIIRERMRFLKRLESLLDQSHKRIGPGVEKPDVVYRPFPGLKYDATEQEILLAFTQALERLRQREYDRGQTLSGPHRDELVFLLDGKEVRRYASQGQHRTFGMALKLAQLAYLKENALESPILLLDDVFDNLDRDRIKIFADVFGQEEMGQSIITAARRDIFDGLIAFSNDRHRLLQLDPGAREGRLSTERSAGEDDSAVPGAVGVS